MLALSSLPQGIVQTTHAAAGHALQTNGAYAVNSSSSGTTFKFVLHDTQLRIFVLLESLSLVLATQEFTVGFGYPSRSGIPSW